MPFDLEEIKDALGLPEGADASKLEELVTKANDLEEGNSLLRKKNRSLSKKKAPGLSAAKLKEMLDADLEDLDDDDEAMQAIRSIREARDTEAKERQKLEKRLAAREEEDGKLRAKLERAGKRDALMPHIRAKVAPDFHGDAFDWLAPHVKENGDGYHAVGADGEPLKTKDGKPVTLEGLVADIGKGDFLGTARPRALIGHEGRETTGPAPPASLPGATTSSMSREDMREKYGPKEAGR